jgi:hypothetical protein
MVISVKETTVFSVFHPDAQDLYNTCSDLKKVAWELWDPSHRLRAEVCDDLWSINGRLDFLWYTGQGRAIMLRVRSYVVQAANKNNRRNCERNGRLRIHHRGKARWRAHATAQARERVLLLLKVFPVGCYNAPSDLFFFPEKARITRTYTGNTLQLAV